MRNLWKQSVDLMISAQPESVVDMRQGPDKPDDEGKDQKTNKKNQGEDNPMEGKGDKVSEVDLGAPERDLLEYDFNEAEDDGADKTLMLITPPLFMSPTKEPS